ncbi:radical SAM family heme chaperone HemW [Geoalkalibacter halelectricus]|uniref:radical SAM family heme chaperone HemW n=1 Tax=Geoalkalibacter halelectricus TaxID=2847045 RepID=UPI003D1C5557
MSSLYIHVPFCRRKCPYCDFFSVAATPAHLEAYADLLAAQLRWVPREGFFHGPLATVFFGGGTPSLLSAQAVGAVLAAAAQYLGIAAQAEISLEANPGTLDPRTLSGYRAAGVNRLSLGVQSLDAESLQRLGRLHGPAEARRAVAEARAAGFDSLSLDLMFALPGQSLEGLERDIDAFLALEPDHLSCYGLSIEEHTSFHQACARGELLLPDEDTYAAAFNLVHARLTAAGFEHYEISNYARPGHFCRHNQVYWQRRPYLGIGAGAHSFRDRGWGERWAVEGDLEEFRRRLEAGRNPSDLLETFERQGAMAETLYLGLRTRAGVEIAEFQRRFGCTPAQAFPQALRRIASHLRPEPGRLCLGVDGWLLYDHLIEAFF